MVTFLDLLVLVVMVLSAVSLLTVALMFLVKNRRVKQVCLYLIAALGVYMGYVGFRILWPGGFMAQVTLAALMALVSVGAVVLERLNKGNQKAFLTAQILASVSLTVGMLNAFM